MCMSLPRLAYKTRLSPPNPPPAVDKTDPKITNGSRTALTAKAYKKPSGVPSLPVC